MSKEKTLIVISAIISILFLMLATDGFTTFTIEEKRLNTLKSSPPVIPDIQVEDHLGESYNFSEFEGKHLLMTFIYTNCATACPQMNTSMAELYEMLDTEKYQDQINFLSISFDPTRDTVEVLNRYAEYFNVDGDFWRMLRISDSQELRTLLDLYGVTVIPDGSNDFQHNTSFYLIGPEGQLLEVFSYDDVETTHQYLISTLEEDSE